MNEISEGIKMAEELLRTINVEKMKVIGKTFLYACILGTGVSGMLGEFGNTCAFIQQRGDLSNMHKTYTKIYELIKEDDEKETEND